MKSAISLVFGLLFSLLSVAQSKESQSLNRPKLVIGIVIDQMRWDYLYRYNAHYKSNGFKKLLREGFSCENTFIPYVPTYTAPGHTCVYTGSVPSLHGIIANTWYNKSLKRNVYCTEDNAVQGVGSNAIAGKQSPKNLWANTITDELRLATNFRNKTIAIALKDRGSILPGGHTANAAYWFDTSSGQFISSSFYMKELPSWVQTFNAKKWPDIYLKQGWQLLYPSTTYAQSTADNEPYESSLPGEDNTFEHHTDTILKNKYESFHYLPFGNSYTFQMAKAAIEGEQLGKSGFTDFLAVSCSSTDYIGHAFGPNSVEVEDTYLRLDKDLADFLGYLDIKIGKGNYLLFLTADHGVAHNAGFSEENSVPAGVLNYSELKKSLESSIESTYGLKQAIVEITNCQIYLNDEAIMASKVNTLEIKRFIIQALLKYPGVAKALDIENISNSLLPEPLKTMVVNGYNQKLSGDLLFILQPQWYDYWGGKGSTHGAWSPYDSHIPLLWYGWNIQPGKLNRKVYMTDIAPTLAAMLKIQMPNASIGDVIIELIK